MCISFLVLQICGGYLGSSGSSEKCFRFKNSVWEKYTSTKEKRYLAAAVMHNDKLHMYGTFHEQHSAAENGHVELCRLIMDEIEDIFPKTKDKTTPLHLATRGGHIAVKDLILKYVEKNC